MIPVRDDELTEYPETEYEDPTFNAIDNGGGGLFSGKGAAKGNFMKIVILSKIRIRAEVYFSLRFILAF